MPFLWLLLVLPPLLILERWIHRHLQGVILLAVRRPDVATVIYSLLFLPGVIVHEASHWLMAKALFVRTGRFSVWPSRQRDGTLRLGFVETAKVDFLREALIGAAPLIAGVAAVSFVAYDRLGAGPVGAALAAGDLFGALGGLAAMTRTRDSWLWVYLIFTVSNAMMPSGSDRRAWPWVAVAVTVPVGVLAYAGFGNELQHVMAAPLDNLMRALAAAFTITVGLNLCIAPLIYLTELGVMRLTGLRVEY